MDKLPKYSELPLKKDDPFRSAWGLYGKDDQLGFLNRLTDEVVLEAAKEIQSGKRISLNWPLDAQKDIPFFGRQTFHKHVYAKPPRTVNDDTWSFNTQSSSQWDGLRHFAYQKEAQFYNGVTMSDIHDDPASTVNGIQAVAEAQGVSFKFGDILIIRSGYMVAYNAKPRAELQSLAKIVPPTFSGVEQSEEVLEWIWENFAAVAGDQPSFECWPSQTHFLLHEVLLAGWGCPIGEMFDLEALAEHCQMTGRYTFFVTSEVCNVPGGVASPPNILAIF
ncbi:hypothetical protein BU16DRAFT_546554 [Lophium mytilinum]|uniref:Cyclase n=1 Tax=Lophium mytilinum TaxID=390894 RepID=A0A6A6RBZ6_9PEZI|nr:hypothetical protein BU16DRAFT_546554 [Lophium mytilinum]